MKPAVLKFARRSARRLSTGSRASAWNAGQVYPAGFAAEPIVDRDIALGNKHERSTFLCVAVGGRATHHIVVIAAETRARATI